MLGSNIKVHFAGSDANVPEASAREVLTNEILKRFKEYKKVPTGNDVKRTQTLYYAAKMSKKKYEELCGPQD